VLCCAASSAGEAAADVRSVNAASPHTVTAPAFGFIAAVVAAAALAPP
jgi:hypothetical protein